MWMKLRQIYQNNTQWINYEMSLRRQRNIQIDKSSSDSLGILFEEFIPQEKMQILKTPLTQHEITKILAEASQQYR